MSSSQDDDAKQVNAASIQHDDGEARAVESADRRDEEVEVIPSTSRTPQDVLCGRGMPFQLYPGNLHLHRVADSYRDEYMGSRRAEKPKIIKKIIKEIRDTGARFIKPHGTFRSNDQDSWVEVDEQYAYEKVAHVLRHRKKSLQGVSAAGPKEKSKKPPPDQDEDKKPPALPSGQEAVPVVPSEGGGGQSVLSASVLSHLLQNQPLLTGQASGRPETTNAAAGLPGHPPLMPPPSSPVAIGSGLLSSGLLDQLRLLSQNLTHQHPPLSFGGLQPGLSLDQSILSQVLQEQLLREASNQQRRQQQQQQHTLASMLQPTQLSLSVQPSINQTLLLALLSEQVRHQTMPCDDREGASDQQDETKQK